MVKYRAIKWKKRSSSKAMRRARGGRRRRRQRRDHFVVPEIHFDLMIEILRRLPAKSLMRFRLHHLHRDCDHLVYSKLQLTSISSNSAESSLEPELTFPGMGGHKMVVRGLILYTLWKQACIYNPTTRQRLILPVLKSNILDQKEPKYVHYFFGHDPVHDHYKIVCTILIHPRDHGKITSEHWVFLLEPRGFWKNVEYDDQPHMPTRDGLCVDGVIYYLAFTRTCRDNVYCFDVRSEEFSNIEAPHEVSVDSGTWSRKSLVLKPCQRHLVDDINNMKLRVHGTGQNNEVILALLWPRYLIYYDLIKNDLRKVNINREITPDQHLYVMSRL
ncbi:hypothetical protein HID58_084720 [Brassica napus]|uniref:F-box associated beta-propeller type 3 domain-containing protein n=1 Tax=Brassica napus TaxID=3708 RepID=A0ABQ7XKI5_BRANA|nr:hypothetical protein HID58_084720 [Brassica napus]